MEQNERIKIFVSAYACEPDHGSEIGVGWHWVLEMNKYFELWVLTRLSNKKHIEGWLASHPQKRDIHFLYWDLPDWARKWKKGMRGVRVYYYLWQKYTNRIVKQTMLENEIKIYHLLTYGNALFPASKFGMKQFFIWGPVSAGVMLPRDFTKHYSFFSRIKEEAQRISSALLPYNYGFLKRCYSANLILCKTDDTISYVPNSVRERCVQFTDVAVERKEIGFESVGGSPYIVFLMAGTLVGWRNVDVLIEAFYIASIKNENIRLRIIGSGDEENKLKSLVAKLNLEEKIKMLGQLSIQDYYKEMAAADVVINPCFREGAVTVSFDSMNFSKPLICFDTKGYTHYFSDEYSRVIKGVTTRDAAIKSLAEEILNMTNREVIHEMGLKAHEAGKKIDWQHKGKHIYEVIMNHYDSSRDL